MSLVNDMLKDLEQRRAVESAPALDLSWLGASRPTVRSPNYSAMARWLIPLALVGLLALWMSQRSVDVMPAQVVGLNSELAPKIAPPSDTHTAPLQTVSDTKQVLSDTVESVPDADLAVSETKNTSLAEPAPVAVVSNTVEAIKPAAVAPSPVVVEPEAKPLVKTPPTLTPSQRDELALGEARQQLARGNRAAAITLLQQELGSNDEALRSAAQLASLQLQLGEMDVVRELLADWRGRYPGDLSLRELEARRLLQTGDVVAAVNLLDEVKPSLAENFPYYELQAAAAQRAGQYPVAANIYEGLLELEARGDWWAGLAIARDQQGDGAGARQAYQRALQATDLSATLRNYAQQRLQTMQASTVASTETARGQ